MKYRSIGHAIRFAGLVSVLALYVSPAAWSADSAPSRTGHRTVVSLDGTWEVDDSVNADAPPQKYTHHVPVPGLAHSASPPFVKVDEYQSRELLVNLVGQKKLDPRELEALGNRRGRSLQDRNYFWYRRTFSAPSPHAVGLLRINKAQFGIEVFLNGVSLGTHAPCFTSATFDASRAIKWGEENIVVIRVGAHPGVLPEEVSAGTDFEKNRWTPGIYDDVTFSAMNNPVISEVQAAPDVSRGGVTVQTELHNYGSTATTTVVNQAVSPWKGDAVVAQGLPETFNLAANETRVVTRFIPIPHAHLWSTDDPYLYKVATSTAGDRVETRFGMRDFHFDTATKRAYLNGQPFFMRGSNITLHRFFEDKESGTLPWNEAWLQRLLVTIPKELHWNAFRFCIGPVPDRWLQIADENGLIIQNEYMVWTGPGTNKLYTPSYNSAEMIQEFTEWMRDNWNHPGVGIWDASNESVLPDFSEKIVPAVRGLDLSKRPWEDGYNAPSGPDDPVEEHQYLTISGKFSYPELENMEGPRPSGTTSKSGHAKILNEYGWLWLNRDGSPTLLTEKTYERLLSGQPNTAQSRFELQDSLLQGETEFWRAYREYAGVLHFVYLTSSEPGAFTADHFQSVRELKLRPGFEHAMEQAFNPLGVYLNFWQAQVVAGEEHRFTILMVNDDPKEKRGKLALSILDAHGVSQDKSVQYDLPPYGSMSYMLPLQIPSTRGKATVMAVAVPDGDKTTSVTSQRFTIVH